MSEAVCAIIDHGFTKMNLNRIEALVGINNVAFLRLMKKYNFIKEGVLRKHMHISDKYEDSVMFSKLSNEYINENY